MIFFLFLLHKYLLQVNFDDLILGHHTNWVFNCILAVSAEIVNPRYSYVFYIMLKYTVHTSYTLSLIKTKMHSKQLLTKEMIVDLNTESDILLRQA